MKKIYLIAALGIAFLLGFKFREALPSGTGEKPLKRVTGIGGVFFKSGDPKKLKEWYRTHLGLQTDKYGTVFIWYQGADSTKKGFTQWSAFNAKTEYFKPSEKDFMLNYRVADLTRLAAELKKEGVTIVDTIETYDYGKFLHIMDIDGNKIELWEPVDSVYGRIEGGRTM